MTQTQGIQGIIHITGEPDSGKTLAALTAAHPKDTLYFFDDVKAPPVPETEFKGFVDLVSQYSDLKLLEFRKAVLERIEGIKPGDYQSIVWDTWSRFGLALRNYAIQNPGEFREPKTFSKMGSAKGGEMWNEAHRYEASVISQLSKLAPLVILVTHIKDLYIGGARSGSQKPDCGRAFDKVCNLRLWLRHNPDSGVPIALTLKRISKAQITPDGLEPVNVLPRKITPFPNHKTIWEPIQMYWEDPMGNGEPQGYETPTPYELSILDGVLTKDQKEVWRAELAAQTQEELPGQEYDEVRDLVLKLHGEGVPVPIIKAQVDEKYPGYDLAQVVKITQEA